MAEKLLPLAGDLHAPGNLDAKKSQDRIVPVFKPIFKAKTMQSMKTLPAPRSLGATKKPKPKVSLKQAAKQTMKAGAAGILSIFFWRSAKNIFYKTHISYVEKK